MHKYRKLLLILAAALFGLSACGVSSARKEPVENRPSPSPERAETKVTPTPEKQSKTNDNSVELTAEDVKNGSVKSDDYDANMKNGKDLCDVEAFVVDEDPQGLNIRADGSTSAKIIGKIPFDEEGIIVHITGANYAGWMIIDRAKNMEGETVFKGKGWVAANMLATSTRGYGTNGVKLYEYGSGSKVLTVIPVEEVVKIRACNQKNIRVVYKKFDGWLDEEAQCANPMTNCS